MTQHANAFVLSARFWSTLTVLGIALFLMPGCSIPGPNAIGSSMDSEPRPTITLTIKARAASSAPADFGVVPGDRIAGAEVAVSIRDSSNESSYSAMTDESGSVDFMVPSSVCSERAS